MTNHLILRTSCTKLLHELNERLENEWHTGDEYDRLVWRIDRVEDFREYVKLHARFNSERRYS